MDEANMRESDEQRAFEVLADVLGLRGAQRQSYLDGNMIPIVFPSDGVRTALTFATTIAAEARLEERERCARICDNWNDNTPFRSRSEAIRSSTGEG